MLDRGRILSRRARYREDISPVESLVNLVDVMLVFICGLLISIIIFWNINMENLVIILDQEQLIEIENPDVLNEQMKAIDSYGDLGAAVLDPRTGTFMLWTTKTTPPGRKKGKQQFPLTVRRKAGMAQIVLEAQGSKKQHSEKNGYYCLGAGLKALLSLALFFNYLKARPQREYGLAVRFIFW